MRFFWHRIKKSSKKITLVRDRKKIITVCAIATSCCISDVPRQWKNQKFDPPLLPHFSTDLSETQKQARHRGYDPARKIWLMWDDGKGVCENGKFWLIFVFFFFCTLRRVQITPLDRSRPMRAQNACLCARKCLLGISVIKK